MSRERITKHGPSRPHRNRVHLGQPTTALIKSRPRCRHPKDEPHGYLAWHDWAARKSKTHRAVRCREHGLFHNWVPRTEKGAEVTERKGDEK